jgi:hypothetical protein
LPRELQPSIVIPHDPVIRHRARLLQPKDHVQCLPTRDRHVEVLVGGWRLGKPPMWSPQYSAPSARYRRYKRFACR